MSCREPWNTSVGADGVDGGRYGLYGGTCVLDVGRCGLCGGRNGLLVDTDPRQIHLSSTLPTSLMATSLATAAYFRSRCMKSQSRVSLYYSLISKNKRRLYLFMLYCLRYSPRAVCRPLTPRLAISITLLHSGRRAVAASEAREAAVQCVASLAGGHWLTGQRWAGPGWSLRGIYRFFSAC